MNVTFSGVFDGTIVDGNTYTNPTSAKPWAGFANEDSSIYPFTFEEGGNITFTGSANSSADIYFRFEKNPHPNTEPSFNTDSVTLGKESTAYTIDIPSQGGNTFSSFLLYVTTPDVAVTLSNVDVDTSGTPGPSDVYGCMDENATNYDSTTNEQGYDQYGNSSCVYVSCDDIPEYGCIYGDGFGPFNDGFDAANCVTYGGTPCEKGGTNILGCIDSTATNYNADATVDNGSCNYAQEIQLPGGWFIFSTYINVENQNMVDILSNINNQVIICKDYQGNAYLPEYEFNNIGNLTNGWGYQIKTSAKCTLSIEGFSVSESYAIELFDGWNLLGYLKRDSTSTIDLFNELLGDTNIDQIIIAKDYAGNAYLPDFNFTGFAYMYPGQGYLIKTARTSIEPYTLVWSDEFEVDGAINSDKWFHQTQLPNGSGWYNNEQQHYTNRTENSRVENNQLHITAIRENFTDQGQTKLYTSARLNSKFAFKYGKVEIRAKLPSQPITWPAIWTLGKNITEPGAFWYNEGYGTTPWPACGEIDIMEHWGDIPNVVSSAIHTPSSYGGTINYGAQIINTVTGEDAEFHIYTLEWTPNEMIFAVDNIEHYRYNPKVTDANTWPFDAEQYLLLNVAIQAKGAINTEFIDTYTPMISEESDSMIIDYVKVYQKGSESTNSTL